MSCGMKQIQGVKHMSCEMKQIQGVKHELWNEADSVGKTRAVE